MPIRDGSSDGGLSPADSRPALGSRLRVLIVEDSPADAALVVEELRAGGYDPQALRVDTAAAMTAALDAESFDLVISDFSMPRFSGLAALRLFRERDVQVPFFLVSGTVGEDAAVTAMKAGASDYVMKDNLTRLAPAIARELGDAETRRQQRRVTQELAEVRRQRELILESAGEGIYGVDDELRSTFFNRAALDMLGFTAEELLGRFMHGLLHHTRPDGSPYPVEECPIGKALKDGLALRVTDEVFWRGDGTSFPVEYLATPILDQERIRGAVVVFRDVTETRRKEQELREALRQAQESDRLKSAFLANVSHEIRTPLNGILGYASLIAEELEERGDESQRALVEGLQRSSNRLLHTVTAVLDIALLETDGFPIHLEEVDLAELVERVVGQFRPLAEAKDLALSVDLGAARPIFLVDDYCISQSLAALLDNAIKFTRAGSVHVTLGREAGDSVVIEVRDTGVGIDGDYRPRLGALFSQQDQRSTRAFEGIGLGLALATRYLARTRAHLSIDSVAGEGSVFRIHLPGDAEVSRGETGIAAPAAAESGGSGSPAAGEQPKPVLLAVEDDRESQIYLKLVLGRRYEILVAEDASEFRRHLESRGEEVRLVLMDVSLAGEEDGLALTRALRRDERWRHLPVIATTAHAMPEDRHRGLEAGCDAYLTKPIRRVELESTIESLIAAPPGSAETTAKR